MQWGYITTAYAAVVLVFWIHFVVLFKHQIKRNFIASLSKSRRLQLYSVFTLAGLFWPITLIWFSTSLMKGTVKRWV